MNNKIKIIIISAAIIISVSIAVSMIVIQKNNSNHSEPTDTTTKISQSQTEESSGTESTTNATSTTKIDKTQWNLILVNKDNYIPENYKISLKQLDNGHSIDERCYEDLQQMMDDCRAEGLEPVICSSYRTNEKQTELFNRQIEKWKSLGYSDSDAEIEAGKLVAVPGTSEHQLGLALDIVDISYQILDEKQENTAVQKWLMQNSYRYGFILRYPTDKRDITGISYEPWHYRYVGKAHAKAIYDSNLCLEEYLKQ